MKKQILIGVTLASFSLAAFAQSDTKIVGNVTIKYPGAQSSYSPQPGVKIDFPNAGYNSSAINNDISANKNAGLGNLGNGNGIGMDMDTGAPKLSDMSEKSVDLNKPINLQEAPEGASEIMNNGNKLVNTVQSNELSQKNNNPLIKQSKNNMPSVNKEQKSDVIITDISAWNKTTINKFEEEGKARTEARYKEFLLNK